MQTLAKIFTSYCLENLASGNISDISLDEIYHALNKIQNNRAPMEDRVLTESIKMRGPMLIRKSQGHNNRNISTK